MSSIERSYRAIDSNVKFFICVSNVSNIGFTVSDLESKILEQASFVEWLGSVVNATGISASSFVSSISPSIDISGGELLRDMGKTLYIQDNATNYSIYKLVQQVDGAESEGVPNNSTFNVPNWNASGSNIANLARTGY